MRIVKSRKICAPFIAFFAMSGRSDKIAAGRVRVFDPAKNTVFTAKNDFQCVLPQRNPFKFDYLCTDNRKFRQISPDFRPL